MIIEFLGISGAGKTTLCRAVYHHLREQNAPAFFPLELFLGRQISSLVESERVQHVLFDVIVLPWLMFNLRQHLPFIKFAYRCISERVETVMGRVLLMRSVLRKVGLHCILRMDRFGDKVILVDEGTVHSAHVIFVYGKNIESFEGIEKFLDLVPFPDKVIHVVLPLPLLIKRTLERNDPPLRRASKEALQSFVVRAFGLFEFLFAKWPFQYQEIVLDVDGGKKSELLVEGILHHIQVTRDRT